MFTVFGIVFLCDMSDILVSMLKKERQKASHGARGADSFANERLRNPSSSTLETRTQGAPSNMNERGDGTIAYRKEAGHEREASSRERLFSHQNETRHLNNTPEELVEEVSL